MRQPIPIRAIRFQAQTKADLCLVSGEQAPKASVNVSRSSGSVCSTATVELPPPKVQLPYRKKTAPIWRRDGRTTFLAY